jgi:small-conductance mechanosensitive channel
MKKIFTPFVALLLLAAPITIAIAQDSVPPINEKDVLDHLDEINTWQKSILAIDTTANNSLEKLLKETLERSSAKVVKHGFEFARTEAITLASQKKPVTTVEDPNTPQSRIKKATADVVTRIDELQKQQKVLETQIRRTPRRLQSSLLIQREKIAGELKIALARQDLLQSVATMYSDQNNSESSVLDKINNLSSTLPPTVQDNIKKVAAPAAATTSITNILPIMPQSSDAAPDAAATTPKSSHGIIGISSDMIDLFRKKKEIDTIVTETNALMDNNQRLVSSLRTTLQDAVKSGNEMAAALNSADKETITLQRANIDTFVDNFKQLSTAVAPLARINFWLDASKKDLKEWRDSLDEQMTHLSRSLLLQLAFLVFAIVVPLGISEAVRRAIHTYVHDSKRQRQLNIARRILFAVVIFLIILLNFVSEFSSIATFAGFLTAGVAVALQNIILSVVAHFFFFGRFGVRVGDRVTVKDITGEVVQVGITRLYLMELGGPDAELYPTGRIVAFPNSILFQNEPFTKQISGADYSWQEITFILDPSSDYQLANKKLNEAVNIVYSQYHDVMESQKQAMTRSTHLDVNMPAPKGFLNFTDSGLALIIRYPIQTDHIAEINQRVTNALLDAIGKEPSLKLLSSNPPKIVSIDHD